MGDRITRVGKQLLFDGKHLADGRDEETAEVIRICLQNFGCTMDSRLTVVEAQVLERFFA
jgi:hypothetical protein